MGECVFCRIIAGDIPAATLLETDKVISFLDINPVNPGHALVVPKRHVSSLLDLNQEELHVAI
ncbi:MAG: HIT family protein, partial [Planctomycetota bacterium]